MEPPVGRPGLRCGACGYDLAGLKLHGPEAICPECGAGTGHNAGRRLPPSRPPVIPRAILWGLAPTGLLLAAMIAAHALGSYAGVRSATGFVMGAGVLGWTFSIPAGVLSLLWSYAAPAPTGMSRRGWLSLHASALIFIIPAGAGAPFLLLVAIMAIDGGEYLGG